MVTELKKKKTTDTNSLENGNLLTQSMTFSRHIEYVVCIYGYLVDFAGHI